MDTRKRRISRTSAAVVALLWLAVSAVPAMEFQMAPDGNDAWSGKLAHPNAARNDGPLASLTGARNAIRQWKQAGRLSEPITVVVANGQYPFTTPLELDFADTGTALAPISYEAAPGAHPVFSGGRALHGWQLGTNGLWQTHIPDVAAGHWYFEQLWVNGHRATRARTPNQFWFYLKDVHEEPIARDGGATRQSRTANDWAASRRFQVGRRPHGGGAQGCKSGGLS